MITKLSVKNFALIDFIEINFYDGFSTITGDTGSGKSILLSALSLILGNRINHGAIKDVDLKCVVEADFNLKKFDLEGVFKNNNLDYFDNSIFRREILPNGKSRSFINDTPTNLETMRLVGTKIIDIHTQHESFKLSKNKFFFSLLDDISEQKNIVQNFTHNLSVFNDLKIQLEKLERLNTSLQNDFDYNTYLLYELENVKLDPEEQIFLENDLKILKNSEEILSSINEMEFLLHEGDNSIENQIRRLNSILHKTSKFSDKHIQISTRVEGLLFEIEDIKDEILNSVDEVEGGSKKISEIESRLNLIYTLQKKHSVNSVDELIAVRNRLKSNLLKNKSVVIDIDKLKNEISAKNSLLNEQSKKITKSRNKVIPNLKSNLEIILADLGMDNAKFKFILKKSESYNVYGGDDIEVLFSANRGHNYRSILDVASGGELSRILIAIKSILAQHLNLPTMIFDEIDSGISGEISSSMANLMLKMSKKMQIISITHLAQVAAKGQNQYNVFKKQKSNKISTHIKKLSESERIEEIAKMLSGDEISLSAINHAKELLN